LIKRFCLAFAVLFLLLPLIGMGDNEIPVENNILKIGLMPAVDTAPIFLARDRGYFSERGLEVEITIFTNAQDRQSALQSGAIDGAMTDLVALAVNRAGGFPIKATTLTDGMFPILIREGSRDKKSVSIGLMEISVSNFLVDEWLSADYELDKVYINAIPARLEALASGQLDMGLFPEPIASVGVMKGLEKMIFEPVDGYCPDIMVFTEKALAREEVLMAFHKAYNRAVKDIQSNEGLARDTIMKNIPNLNPELRDLIMLPIYFPARLPDEAFLRKIIDWTDSITSQDIKISGEEMVDRRFTSP
jgi:NitT/TauT family transport system substrate-binding protein